MSEPRRVHSAFPTPSSRRKGIAHPSVMAEQLFHTHTSHLSIATGPQNTPNKRRRRRTRTRTRTRTTTTTTQQLTLLTLQLGHCSNTDTQWPRRLPPHYPCVSSLCADSFFDYFHKMDTTSTSIPFSPAQVSPYFIHPLLLHYLPLFPHHHMLRRSACAHARISNIYVF